MLLLTPLQQEVKLLRDAFDTVERLIQSVGTSTPSSDQDTEFYKLPHCSRQTATIDYSFSPILLIHTFSKMSVSSPDIDFPVELLIYILEFLSSDLYKMYNTYLISRTLEFFSCQQFPPDIPKNLSLERVSLSNTLLVCRTWYGAGATALYSQVHLFTERQLRLFARALKMNSSLSQLVRGFYATGFSPPSQSFFTFFGASNHSRLVRDILYIIKSCHYLEASNVDLDLEKPFMSDHPCIGDCNSYQFQCLRRLELHGDAMVPLLVDCQLPNLDFLHFRSCYFKNPNFLPVLSRLHTLVFTKCSGSPPIHNHPSPILPQNLLPSLRSLQCYDDNFVRPPLVFHPLPPTLCDIRHVASWSQTRLIRTLCADPFMEQITSLTIGILTNEVPPKKPFGLGSWKLPPKLETLTIRIAFDGGCVEMERLVWPLKTLMECFEANGMRRRGNDLTPFRTLRIEAVVHSLGRGGDDSESCLQEHRRVAPKEIEHSVQELKELAGSFGVLVHANIAVGRQPRHLLLKEMDINAKAMKSSYD